MFVTVAIVFLRVMGLATLIIGRVGWPFVRDNGPPEAAGSLGLESYEPARKPQDWLG